MSQDSHYGLVSVTLSSWGYSDVSVCLVVARGKHNAYIWYDSDNNTARFGRSDLDKLPKCLHGPPKYPKIMTGIAAIIAGTLEKGCFASLLAVQIWRGWLYDEAPI